MKIKRVDFYAITSLFQLNLEEPAYRDYAYICRRHPGIVAFVQFSGKGSQSDSSGKPTMARWESHGYTLEPLSPFWKFLPSEWYVPIRPDYWEDRGYYEARLEDVLELGLVAAIVLARGK